MNCKIIFYSARKTSFCERALKKSLAALELNLTDSSFATKNEALGQCLTDAFQSCDIVFLIGGLDFGDSRNAAEIIANAAADSQPDMTRRLKNDAGEDGYLLKSGRQLLVMLPDEPGQLERMLQGEMNRYMKAVVQQGI